MLNVKEAVKRAFEVLADMFDKESLREPRLEEVELTGCGDVWSVTVSFVRPTTVVDAAELGLPPCFEREYKVIEIQAESGQMLSMKIRQLA